MKKYTRYHNPRCRKSREAIQFIEEAGHSHEVVLYLNDFFTKDSLQEILNNIALKPSEIVRENESEWKNVSNRNTLNETEILELLIKYPRLIERPIVIFNDTGVIARPLENLIAFLKVN